MIKKSTFLLAFLPIFVAILASADKQPVLNIYTYDSFASQWGPGPKIKANFEQQCECNLRFIALDSSADILNRIRLEGSGSIADIVLGLDNNLLAEAKATGLLHPHGVDFKKLDLPIKWNDPLFVPFDYGYFSFVYNSEKLPNPPTSLKTLVEAHDDLKILIQDPRTSTPGLGMLLWIKSVYGKKAEQAWRKLAPKVVTVTRGWSQAYAMFMNAEADMVLSYTTSPVYHMIVEGKDHYQAASFKEGHVLQIEVAARLKDAPHPELADQFMAFILKRGFQSAIPTGNWMYPVINMGQALPDKFNRVAIPIKVIYPDSSELKRNKQVWIDEYLRGMSKHD